VEALLEQIKREHADQFARLAQRESAQTKWIIGTLVAFCAITLALIKAIP